MENMCKCCWWRQIYEVNPCRTPGLCVLPVFSLRVPPSELLWSADSNRVQFGPASCCFRAFKISRECFGWYLTSYHIFQSCHFIDRVGKRLWVAIKERWTGVFEGCLMFARSGLRSGNRGLTFPTICQNVQRRQDACSDVLLPLLFSGFCKWFFLFLCSLSAYELYFILARVNCREIRGTLASTIRVYMKKRMTGEHRNHFKTLKKYASTWNVSVVWE